MTCVGYHTGISSRQQKEMYLAEGDLGGGWKVAGRRETTGAADSRSHTSTKCVRIRGSSKGPTELYLQNLALQIF